MVLAHEPSILLVDDSADDCFFTMRALADLGLKHVSRVVDSASGAVERLAVGDVVLVLLDWHLPGEDGPDLLVKVRDAAGPAVAIIVLSGRDDEEVRSAAQAGGARAVLAKPLQPDALRPLLPSVLAALAGNAPA